MEDRIQNSENPETLFIACAALGREVKSIIKKHGWNADFEAINAMLHWQPGKIGRAVEARLKKTRGKYKRNVVVYGHCGAFDLDNILEKYGAVRPLGPHCYEMYGGEDYAKALNDVAGTYILTDFLVRAWDNFVIKALKIDKHPKLKVAYFSNYKRMVYFVQENNDELIKKAKAIADWLKLPLEIRQKDYGDLERRLVAIMEDRKQPVASLTQGGYDKDSYLSTVVPDTT